MPLDGDDGPWAEALFGFAQVKPDGKLTHFPDRLPAVSLPSGEMWARLESRMKKLLRLR
jgi:acyl-CoA thioesterase YciA